MSRMNGIAGVIVSSVAVLLVVLIGWFVFVSPQRSKADRLTAQQTAVDTELATDQALLATPRRKRTQAAVRAAERAMPEQPRVSDVLRQLSQVAAQSRTELDNITPGTPTPLNGSEAIPISLSFKGRYFGLQKLLRLLRQSADVRGGKLVASGRLYTVDSIQFTGDQTTPGGDITAIIALNAFVYTGTAAPVTTPTTTDTTATAAAP